MKMLPKHVFRSYYCSKIPHLIFCPTLVIHQSALPYHMTATNPGGWGPTCFVQDMSSQPTSFQIASYAPSQGITGTLCPLPHTWADRRSLLASVSVIDRGERKSMPSLPPRERDRICSLTSQPQGRLTFLLSALFFFFLFPLSYSSSQTPKPHVNRIHNVARVFRQGFNHACVDKVEDCNSVIVESETHRLLYLDSMVLERTERLFLVDCTKSWHHGSITAYDLKK